MRRIVAPIAAAVALAAFTPAGAVNVNIGDANPVCPTVPSNFYECQNVSIYVNAAFPAVLDATFYYPRTAGPFPKQVPAVLMTHGYGGWHRSAGDIASAVKFANEGYAVLSYTSRGFGRSTGQVMLQSREGEVQDAMDLISWLAYPPNTGDRVILDGVDDPRVGMSGGSYAGGIQLLTAAQDPARRLDAITPQITWNDLRYSLGPNGVTKHGWIDLLYASGKYSGLLGPLGGAPPVVSTDGVPVDQDIQVLTSYATNENFASPAPYSDGTTNSYDYLARRSVANLNIGGITAATFFIQGQRDTLFNINEPLATRRLLPPTTPSKFLVFSGGHGYSDLAGERDMINARILTWFKRYLRHDAVDTGPLTETWRPWITGANFAVPGSDTQTAVTLTGPASATLLNAVAPTSHSETTNFQGQTNSPAIDLLPGVTAQDYPSAPLPSDAYVFGTPYLHFTINSASPEAIVFAKLWDEDTTGARTLIHRLVSPARIRGGIGDFCSQHLTGATLDPTSSVANVNVCLAMAGITWKFPKDHKLVLTIATSDSEFFGSRIPGAYTISDVSLSLPVVSF
jgi:ABC-2 type transport system ATP-binding protein